jgi:hypothetical protein
MLTNYEDFARNYARMSDMELLELAVDFESLVGPAQEALRAEVAARDLEMPSLPPAEEEVAAVRSWTTVRKYRDLSEAIVARGALEAAGIEAFLCDENLARLDWQLTNYLGGLRLQVEEKDAAAAEEILSGLPPEVIPYAADASFGQLHCPKCGSLAVRFEGASRGVAMTFLFFFSIPMPKGRKSWSCDDCGARWMFLDEDEGS